MALTKTPIELSSTPGIVDNSNATAITIDASENVGIGTSSPRSILDLDGGSETQLRLQTNNTGSASSDGLLISLDSSANADAYLWNYENAAMIFGTNAIERMRIDASGHLMVGTTDTAPGAGDTNAGVSIRGGSDNRSFFSVNGDYPMHLNRNTNDGEILWFAKNGGAVGSAGTTTSAGGTRFAIGAVGDPGIIFAGTGVFPATQITASDNVSDLGSANYRWKDIYLSGGVNFSANANAGGMTSELLDDYEEGAWTLASTTSGVTISSQSCRYTKVGRLVTLNGAVTFSALPSNISTQHFSGAPFNCWAEHSVGIVREASTTGAAYILQLNANNSTLGMNSYSGVANGSTRIFAVNESYNFSLTYTIA